MKHLIVRWLCIMALLAANITLAPAQEEKSSIPDFEEIAAQYEDNAAVDSLVADDIARLLKLHDPLSITTGFV